MPTIEHLAIQQSDTLTNLQALESGSSLVVKGWYWDTDNDDYYFADAVNNLVGPIDAGSSYITSINDTSSIQLSESGGELTASVIDGYIRDLFSGSTHISYSSFSGTFDFNIATFLIATLGDGIKASTSEIEVLADPDVGNAIQVSASGVLLDLNDASSTVIDTNDLLGGGAVRVALQALLDEIADSLGGGGSSLWTELTSHIYRDSQVGIGSFAVDADVEGALHILANESEPHIILDGIGTSNDVTIVTRCGPASFTWTITHNSGSNDLEFVNSNTGDEIIFRDEGGLDMEFYTNLGNTGAIGTTQPIFTETYFNNSGFMLPKGPGTQPLEVVAANTTLDLHDHTILVDTSGGNRTITFPDEESAHGKIYEIIKLTGANTVNLSAGAGNTFFETGAATAALYEDRETIVLRGRWVEGSMLWYTISRSSESEGGIVSYSGTSPSIDLRDKLGQIAVVDLGSNVTVTPSISNARTGGIYTFHFHSGSGTNIVLPSNFKALDRTTDLDPTGIDELMIVAYFDGTNFYGNAE